MNKEIDDLTDFSLVEALCNLLPATLPAAPEGGSMHATDPGLRRRRRRPWRGVWAWVTQTKAR